MSPRTQHTILVNPTPTVAQIMQKVLIACVPGIIVLTHFFGPGVLMNLLAACVFGVLLEALVLKARHLAVKPFLSDYSALVTAVLLGISLPPYSPWWLIAIGMSAALVVGKHLFGGIGQNPFNPAMVGYAVLLISFPIPMTQWVAPHGLAQTPGIVDALLSVINHRYYDGITMATPLDLMKQNEGQTMTSLFQLYPQFGRFAGVGWEWVNLAFLAGGLWMLHQRLFTWHGPVGMLTALALLSALFYDGGSSASGGSPTFHLLSGATMFGAFFIVTDPSSGATSNQGRFVFGALVGILVYCIRVWGNYPDAIAFAVLLANFCAPLIDHYTIPKAYGYRGPRS